MKYFREEEFNCNCGCDRLKLDPDFAKMIDEAREQAGVRFVVTSGYRCPTYNISVGGKKDSAHIHGKAADIACLTSPMRYWILYGLLKAGFDRIGIGAGFIHADTDDSKTGGIIWHYYR